MSKHYIHQSGQVIEVDREEPRHNRYYFATGSDFWKQNNIQWDDYEKYLSTCPRYPWRGEPMKEGERLPVDSVNLEWTCKCPTYNIIAFGDRDKPCKYCNGEFVQVAYPVSPAAKGEEPEDDIYDAVRHYRDSHPEPAEGKQGDGPKDIHTVLYCIYGACTSQIDDKDAIIEKVKEYASIGIKLNDRPPTGFTLEQMESIWEASYNWHFGQVHDENPYPDKKTYLSSLKPQRVFGEKEIGGFYRLAMENQYSIHQSNDRWYDVHDEYIGTTSDLLTEYINTQNK